MSGERPAPDLPGLTYVAPLGSGGSAEVHLYDQRLPARRVAVKVLREPVRGAAEAAAFVAEANAMAALVHPHIVGVLAAGIAADGRPYLVLPHFARPDLETRCRAEPLPPAEALRVGVQIGGALETAHRHGVLHRDVKPANLLVGRDGAPALADFGLAGAPGDADGPEYGLSVPWAAPEVLFGTAPASVRSDCYSLAATVWTLLAGRSPYESSEPGDTTVRLLRRIRAGALPPLGGGVPAEVDAVLAAALAPDPARRPASVLAWVEEVRALQRRLGLPVTEPVVLDPAGDSAGPSAASRPGTPRVAAVLGVSPRAASAARPTGQPTARRPAPLGAVAAGASTPADRLHSAADASGQGDVDAARAAAPEASRVTAEPPPGRPPRRPSRRLVGLAALGVALGVAMLVAGGWLALQPRAAEPTVTITGARQGERVAFAWAWTPRAPGDTFEVLVRDRVVTRAEPTLDLVGAGPQCVRVRVLDAAGTPHGGFSAAGCAG